MSTVALEPVFFVPLGGSNSGENGGLNQWLLSSESNPIDGFAGVGNRFVADQANDSLRYLAGAESFAPEEWPMVFVGPSGVGKTTLAVGLGARIASRRNAAMTFWTAVEFSRRYRLACETDSLEDWREMLAGSGVLVIDQLDELNTHPAAQKELVLVLDLLQTKQIPTIFTVKQLTLRSGDLMPQLESRLSAGLNLSIRPPGLAARELLVQSLATDSNLSLSGDAINYVAQQLPVTVPRIRHFLNQLYTKLTAEKSIVPNISEAVVAKQLDRFRSVTIKTHCDAIMRCVAGAFKLKPTDVKSSSRKQTIALARAIAIYFQRTMLNLSFTKIGANFGGRDHSTIVHSKNKIEKIVNGTDPKNDDLRRLIAELDQQITDQMASSMPV